jgi:hypothetical protein
MDADACETKKAEAAINKFSCKNLLSYDQQTLSLILKTA